MHAYIHTCRRSCSQLARAVLCAYFALLMSSSSKSASKTERKISIPLPIKPSSPSPGLHLLAHSGMQPRGLMEGALAKAKIF